MTFNNNLFKLEDYTNSINPYRQNICWICGDNANSGEHRIKKSDIHRKYGKAPFKGENSVLYSSGDRNQLIQGPDSKKLKYINAICSNCNNNVTQPYDKAYTQFINWIFDNEEQILKCRKINLTQIYEKNVSFEINNLIKYYIKHLGCKINDIKRPIPKAFSESILGNHQLRNFEISFYINITIYNEKNLTQLIGNGPLIGNHSYEPTYYTWNQYISWFNTQISYNVKSDTIFGDILLDSSNIINVGEIVM